MQRVSSVHDERFFWVVGHRGSPTVEVENTLPSFERAIEGDGANALELDLCTTRDRDVVVWHDFAPRGMIARLRRWGLEPDVRCRPLVLDAERLRRPTCELTAEELRTHWGYADRRGRVDAEIPTLAQFLEWAAHKTRLGLVFLDVKIPGERLDQVPVLLARLDALLARVKARFRIVLEAGEVAVARELARLAPHYEHALDAQPHPGLVLDFREASAVRTAIENGLSHATAQKPRKITLWPFTTHYAIVARDLARMQSHNTHHPDAPLKGLWSFTINRADQMKKLVELGVTGIQSDKPGLLRDIATACGRRV